MKLTELTALELGAAIKRGEISVEEAVQAALEAVEMKDGGLNCFITVTAERALERARTMQAGVKTAESPLYGVPMAFKDNLCTQGIKTTCASRMLENFVPPYDATVVTKLRGVGSVSLGKLNMDEFAMGSTNETSFFGSVRNPWDPERVPGGSSGGAAAAVAAGLSWYAVGSDTGGSIRQPAALCGVTGMKPTYGTVSRYGLIAYASSLDQVGPLCRDAADCAAVLDVLQGRDRRDSTTVDGACGHLLEGLSGDIRGVKIGLPAEFFAAGLSDETRAAVLAAADVLRGRGAELISVTFPMLEYAVPAYYIIAAAEASSNLARFDGVKYGRRAEHCENLTELYTRSRTEGFGAEVKRRILLGTFVLSAGYYEAYYERALRAKAAIGAAFDAVFRQCDLLLTPVTPAAAPRLGESLADPLEMYRSDIDTVPANLAGLPGLSMPCGFDSAGMPIGAQLIGPRFGEGMILNAAHAFQQETNYHREVPKEGVNHDLGDGHRP